MQNIKQRNSFLSQFSIIILVIVFFVSNFNYSLAAEAKVVTPPADLITKDTATPSSASSTPPKEAKSVTLNKTEASDLYLKQTGKTFNPTEKATTTKSITNSLTASSSSTPTSPDPVKSSSTANKNAFPVADRSTGALTYSFPLTIAPGRNQSTPEVSLNYSSQDNTQDSIVGYGWSFSIPYITRVNKTGTNKLYQDNYFMSSLDGELVNVGTNTYAAKVEKGNFNIYTFNSGTWTMTDKLGNSFIFGNTSQAKQANPQDTNQVFKWMIEKATDSNGNTTLYTYFKDSGQMYPETIQYSGNATSAGIFQVKFTREARPDKISSYASAFPISTNFRISKIESLVNGQVRSTYSLGYSTGDNGLRSLLQFITETRNNEAGGVVSLPKVEFNYSKREASIYNISKAESYTGLSSANPPSGLLVGEFNGDGISDILQAYEYNYYQHTFQKGIYLYNPTTKKFTVSTTQVPTEIIAFSDSANNKFNGGTRVLDINGDGANDLMRTPFTYSQTSIPAQYLFNPTTNQFAKTTNFLPDYTANPWYTLYSQDFNGDGFVDYLQDTNFNGSSFTSTTSLNNGVNGFTKGSFTSTPVYTGGLQHLVFDINGDSLADIIEASGYWTNVQPYYSIVQKVYINTGKTWVLDPSFTLPSDLSYYINGLNGPANSDIEIGDFNNDGLNDIFMLGGALYLNQGKSFANVSIDGGTANAIGNHRNSSYQNPYVMADLNGDGGQDFVSVASSYVMYNTAPGHTDVLTNIKLATGGQVNATYSTSAQMRDASGNSLNNSLSQNIQVVSSIEVVDTTSNQTTKTTLSYEKGNFYFDKNFPLDRKFAGFGKVIETNSQGTKTITYYHQGNANDSASFETDDSYFKIGLPYRTEVIDSSSKIYTKAVLKYGQASLGTNRAFVFKSQELNQEFEGTSSSKDTATTYTYDNTTGNVLTITQYADVVGNSNGSFTDIGSDKATATFTYVSTNNLKGLKTSETLVNQSNVKVKESKFYYDTLALGTASKGNLTKQEDWTSGTTYVTNQKTYNTFGLPITSTDANGNVTTYTYDTFNLYPTQVKNALNQTTTFEYNYTIGKPKKVTDPNGSITQTTYDGLGRTLKTEQSDPNCISTGNCSLVTGYSAIYTDTVGSLSATSLKYFDNSLTQATATYFDSLGREIQTKAQTEPSTSSGQAQYITVDTIYDNLGRVSKKSLPYFTPSISRSPVTSYQLLLTTYSYDTLNRVLTETNALGTTTNTYTPRTITTTDAMGKVKIYTKDALGNLAGVTEKYLPPTLTSYQLLLTTYSYDTLGNLIKLIDANGNIRNLTYDGLSRKLTSEDLHASTDTTFGKFIFTYDNASNLKTKTTPEGAIVTYVYDKLNRLVTEDSSTKAGIETTNVYDTCALGVVRICSITTAGDRDNSSKTYTYYLNGTIKSESVVIASASAAIQPLVTSYTYDRAGNIVTVTNPDNSQVKNTYNPLGKIETVQQKESTDSSFKNVVTNFDYNELGQEKLRVNANGVTTTNTYDPNQLYRLTNIKTTSPVETTTTQTPPPTLNPVLNLTFNGITTDSATPQNPVQHYGTPTFSTRFTGNQALATLGKNNIVVKDTADLKPTQISFGGFVKPAAADSAKWQAVIMKTNSVNRADGYGMYLQTTGEGGKICAFVSSYTKALCDTIPTGEWKHVFFTYDGSTSKLYINGTMKKKSATVPAPIVYKNQDLIIGASNTQTASSTAFGDFWKGELDELQIFKTALDQTTIQTFSQPPVTSITSGKTIQDISYTYDKVGNVLKIEDKSQNTLAKTQTMQYDDLHRLTSVVVSLPQSGEGQGGGSYSESFTYDKLGNLLSKEFRISNLEFSKATYSYDNLGYSNPNATTKVCTSVTATGTAAVQECKDIIYDKNGNTTKVGTDTYTWNFDNRLISSIVNTKTTSYAYDSTGQRVRMTTPDNVVIRYPSKGYNIDSNGKLTKHIFGTSGMLATIEGGGLTAKLFQQTTDQLGSGSIETESTGKVTELADYYAYGSQRTNLQTTGTLDEQRAYTGHELDSSTGLTYANQRYLSTSYGKFISQDIVCRTAGQFGSSEDEVKQNFINFLSDPQSQNCYSYARNNPYKYVDPSGNETLNWLQKGAKNAKSGGQTYWSYWQTKSTNQEIESRSQNYSNKYWNGLDNAWYISKQGAELLLDTILTPARAVYYSYYSRDYFAQFSRSLNLSQTNQNQQLSEEINRIFFKHKGTFSDYYDYQVANVSITDQNSTKSYTFSKGVVTEIGESSEKSIRSNQTQVTVTLKDNSNKVTSNTYYLDR